MTEGSVRVSGEVQGERAGSKSSLMVETDYCGIMTGKKTDKASLFQVFYGELKTAPMIRECAVCIEIGLVKKPL